MDRPIPKSDGSWTYFAPDIAYHWDKIDRGFDELIDVFGADHGGYVKRMNAAVAASDGRVPLDIKLIQLVGSYKNGEPFKMSKRAGTFDHPARRGRAGGGRRDALSHADAQERRRWISTLNKVLEQSRTTPSGMCNMPSARINSVMKKAAEMGVDTSDAALAGADLARLDHPAELELAESCRMAIVRIAARAHDPSHRVFLYDIASDLHSLWNRGNDEVSLRFVQDGDMATTAAKIALVRSVGVVISAGLGILGVTPAKEMR